MSTILKSTWLKAFYQFFAALLIGSLITVISNNSQINYDTFWIFIISGTLAWLGQHFTVTQASVIFSRFLHMNPDDALKTVLMFIYSEVIQILLTLVTQHSQFSYATFWKPLLIAVLPALLRYISTNSQGQMFTQETKKIQPPAAN